MTQIFLMYLPVYHQGVANLFAKYPLVKEIWLLEAEDLRNLAPTHKDLHGIEAEKMKIILENLNDFNKIIYGANKITSILSNKEKIADLELIVPEDEAVKNWLKQNGNSCNFVINNDIFLRWDNKNSLASNEIKTAKNTKQKVDTCEWLNLAKIEGKKSSDWWRQVGCVLKTKNGEVIQAHNTHLPDEQTPYIKGDVRAQFHKGEHFELTTAIHAEAKVIAQAAKIGLKAEGSEIFVTDFPCPVCAKLIGQAGIKKIYYQKGYAMLDGEEILEAFGVEIVQIEE